MFFVGLGTATPPHRYSQTECWEHFRGTETYARLSRRSQVLAERVLCGNNGIETRHLSVGSLAQELDLTPDAMHRRFAEHGGGPLPLRNGETARLFECGARDAECGIGNAARIRIPHSAIRT